MRLGRRFYIALVLIVLLTGIGYVFAPFFAIGQWALFVLAVSALVDGVMLYRIRGIRAFRQCATRFSNGDENTVNIRVESSYPHPVAVEVVDEIPFAFQLRNIDFRMRLQANEGRTITYHLRPTRRGFTLSDGFGCLWQAEWDCFSADILAMLRWMSRYIRPI